MTTTARTIALGTAALVGVVTMGACGLRQTQVEDTATVTDTVRSVQLAGGDGSVTLLGVAGATTATVRRTVTYNGATPPTGTSFRLDAGVLTLGGCGPHCSVAYAVELPAGLPVSGSVDDGAVSLSSVGPVQVTTDDGTITLDDVHGAVDVRTSDGHITGRRLDGGPVRAATDNGSVDLTTTAPQDVSVGTSDGSVTVAVAPGHYVVATRSDAGARDVRVANDPAGDHRIDLSTDNGTITLTPA